MEFNDMTLYDLLYSSIEENELKNLVAKKIELLEKRVDYKELLK